MLKRKLKIKEGETPKPKAEGEAVKLKLVSVEQKKEESLHQPGIIFSGLKSKLSSEELLKQLGGDTPESR